MNTIQLTKDTLKHIVDALAAANACGLRSEVEQVVFDHSMIRAGGIIPLARLAGMVQPEKRDTIPGHDAVKGPID